jgi:excinuclease ABC subunit C
MNLDKIPNKPGCYLFKDSFKKIIYIGKAKNLKKRVSNYFREKTHDSKTRALVKQIKDIDFIVTNNEIEALILENNLIKKNMPKYNINLKDSKRYAYIRVTNEEYPRIILARKRDDKGKYYGPFTSAEKRDYVLYLLNRTFKLRTCKKLPKRACLKKHIGLCVAPCIKPDKKDYMRRVSMAEKILKGKIKELVQNLKKKMKNYSNKQEFEKALELKNQIQAIKYLEERQNVERQKKYDEDIINFIIDKEKIYLYVFNIYKGTLENKQEFIFDRTENFLEEFLVQYYSEEKIPKEIVLPKKISPEVIRFLERKRKRKVQINIPKKGEKKDLLKLVKRNIEISFFSETSVLEKLQKRINLQELPVVIECFDISHLSGTSTVASMVQFRNALADKQNYRKFKIRSVEYIDDFQAISEVIKRRYYRLKKENLDYPNLIIIDGGLGQLNSAIKSLKELNIKIPIISIAKQFEEIYIPGHEKPLRLSKKDSSLKLVQKIRDEAHRFAISYQRYLRKKKLRE